MPALQIDRSGRDSKSCEVVAAAVDQAPTEGRKMEYQRKSSSKAASVAAVLIALTLVSATASAADAQWSGAGTNSNVYQNPFNWFGNFVPGVNDRALFSPAGGIWPGPAFGSGTVTNSQAFINGPWQFFGGAGSENWRVTNDFTLNAGATAIFLGLDVYTGSTVIGNGGFLGVGGSSLYQSGTITTQGTGIFNVNAGNVMFGTINSAGTGTSVVDGRLDSFGLAISGGGQITVNNQLFLNTDAQVSNGTLFLNGNGQMFNPTGARLRITGNSSKLRFSNHYTLLDKTNLDVRAGGDVIAAFEVDLGIGGTGTQTVDGAGSTINALGTTHWGISSGGFATAIFSNSGAGTYQSLRVGFDSIARADVSLLSGGQLTTTSSLDVGPSVLTSSYCRVNVAGGTLNSMGTSAFTSGAQLILSSGLVNFGGDATFGTGSTFTMSGGDIGIGNGRTLHIDGGVVNRTGGFSELNSGATLRIANGGRLTSNSFLDIALNQATGTLLVTGAGSQINSLGDVSDYGGTVNSSATVTFSNSGAGTYAALRIGRFGGKALVNLNSNGQLNVNQLSAGGSIASSAATINIAGGVLNCIDFAAFDSGAVVNLSSGTLILNGDTAFSTGASLSRNGGTIALTPGRTLTFAGGTGSINGNFSLPNGSTLRVTNGGRFDLNNYFDVASNQAAGTLLVNGAGSRVTTLGVTASDWASNAGNAATVTFSNSGAGTYSGLRLAVNGGQALVNINSAASLTVGSFSAGSSVAGSAATINLAAGGMLNILSAANFRGGARVTLADGTLMLNGDSTFTTGATLNGSGDGLILSAGRTLAFDGGVGSFADSYALPSGATMRITNGGLFQTGLYFDVASSMPTGTLLVSGPGSRVIAGGTTPSDWGSGVNATATVTFSNSGAGTYSGLRMGAPNGNVRLNINSNATLHTGSLGTGGGASNVAINIAGGSLTATGSTGFSNGTAIDVNSAGVLQLGSNSTFFAGSTLNVNGGTFRATGTVDVHGGATINYNSGTANIAGSLKLGAFGSGAQVQLAAGRNKILRVGGLDIQNGGKINLADNALIVDYTGASPLPTIRALVATGRTAGAAWNGPGINSSSAAADNRTGIGLLEATEIGSPATFLGQPIDSTSVLTRFVFLGDSNLDGIVNIADFAQLGSNFNSVTHSWFRGDYNYDGATNIGDFALLASNFNQSLPTHLPRGSAVPEPLSGSMLMAAGFTARRRRR